MPDNGGDFKLNLSQVTVNYPSIANGKLHGTHYRFEFVDHRKQIESSCSETKN